MIPHIVLMLCLAASDPPNAPSAAETADRPTVDALLRRLGAGSLETRDEAERKLIAMGPAILPLIVAADPPAWEVPSAPANEATVRRLLVRRRLEELAAARAVEPAVVSLTMRDARPTDVLAALFEQSGNRLSIAPAPPREPRRISVALERATFWEAVDDVLAKAGLALEFSEAGAGLRIVEEVGQKPDAARPSPVAAGPLRVAVDRVEPTGRLHAAGARIVLRIAWEPRLQPLLIRVPMRSVIAEGPAGEAMSAAQRAAVVEAKPLGGSQWLDLPLMLAQPAPPLESLGLLRGSVLLWMAGREHGFEFPVRVPRQRREGVHPSLRVAGAVVELRRVATQGDRLLVTAAVAYDEPSEALASHQTWLTKKPLVLVAPDGGTTAPIEQAVESRSEQGLTTTAVFRMPGDGPRPTALEDLRVRWMLPITIHVVPIDFAIRDVPLPPPR